MPAPDLDAETDGDLAAVVLAALDGEEPGACLEAAVRALRYRGLANPDGAGGAWLRLQRGARELTLCAERGVEPPAPPTQALLERALGAALSRAAEHDDCQKLSERMEMLQAASFEGIFIHDEGVVIDCNERLCEILGYSRDEMLDPISMQRGVAPEELAYAQERVRQRFEGEYLLTCVRKDGSRFRAEFCTKQTRLGERPLRVVALRDVTARERTAELLRESETRLRQILEATFDAVVSTRDGDVVDVSESAERFYGLSREQLLGTPVLDRVAPTGREDVSRRIQERTVGVYETEVFAAGGEIVPVMVVTVMSTLDGEPVRVAALRDLRESRRLEHERRQLVLQVERSQRLESLGVLASGIAHDFNNLLVGVLGGAEALLGSLKDPDDREMARAIRTAGQRAASLTKQMLAYAGRRSLSEIEPVDLAELWEELRTLLGAALSKKAHIELTFAPGSVVLGERATLMQVFMNLLTNASDALEDRSGRITVTTERPSDIDSRWSAALGGTVHSGGWVLARVTDTGRGMDEATQQRIFEPFFSTKPRGHGLGLGSCLGIVKAHGGAILVESTPGMGSTFSVLLPATELRSSIEPHAPRAAIPCHVLVIDDEPLVRAHVRRLLERHGFTVDDAAGGNDGLAAVHGVQPDVVLMDMMMPDLDGVEVVRRLRASGVNVPVVLCSGNLDAARERGLEPGMVQGTLQKPFQPDELLEALDRARDGRVTTSQ
ncbi:MAG TPA: PAS domain S-box protein [Polyangiaceae bacterium]|jgi:PAS domain S-box-containing protein|nr:PAS domain S-box protein [Polyangiaceae bacterium]